MGVFGKPDEVLNCDCERSNQPTLLQSVFLQNDPLINQQLEESGWLQQIAAREGSAASLELPQLVREAWLRTVSRPPTSEESKRGVEHLESTHTVEDFQLFDDRESEHVFRVPERVRTVAFALQADASHDDYNSGRC